MIAQLPVETATPDWLSAEMPPGYQNRLAEVRRLSDELRFMDEVGRLLWQVGDELIGAAQEVFMALGFETEPIHSSVPASIAARLDGPRRLLVHASSSTGVIQKRDAEISNVFRLLQEEAEEGDHVVLVTNCEPGRRPSERPEAIEPEALALVLRLGATVLTGPTLFALGMASLQDRVRARSLAERLHEQNGVFTIPANGSR